MSNLKPIRALLVIPVIVFLASCNMPRNQQTATQSPEQLQTFVAQTVTAHAQSGQTTDPSETPVPADTSIPQPSETPAPEQTNTPLPTDTPTATNTPIPCNIGKFVKDVTIPDGTDFNPGESFVKTWRLKNMGSCSWSSSYDIVFSSGDAMSAPSAVQLTTDIIPPGGTVDVSVTLVAPADPGTYRGNWKLRDGADQVFGKFWVEIEVLAPTSTPTETPTDTPEPKPDLQINLFELDPSTPIQGSPVEVTVQVYNYGDAVAGPFRVEWKGGVNFSSFSCGWDIASLAAHGGRVLKCDTFSYTSWYGTIDTGAYADVNNTVSESNEGNNNSVMTISVDKP